MERSRRLYGLAVMLFLFNCLASISIADDNLFKPEIHFITNYYHFNNTPILDIGDFDGDSRFDVLFAWCYHPRGSSMREIVINYSTLPEPFADVTDFMSDMFYYNYTFTGDWNRDGKDDLLLDLAIEKLFYISPESGIWDASSQPSSTFSGNGWYYTCSFVKGDFNGDRNLDVFQYGNAYKGYVRNLFWGNGDGSFDLLSNPILGTGEPSVVDWNDDGLDDIAIPHEMAIHIYSGNTIRSASLTLSYEIEIPFQPMTVRTYSDSSSGMIELIASGEQNLQYIHLNNGIVEENRPIPIPATFHPERIFIDDFNTDGIPDVMTWDEARISFLFGDPDQIFENRMEYDTPYVDLIEALKVADFDTDGKPDILFFAQSNPEVVVLYNQIPSFTYPEPIPSLTPVPTEKPNPVPLNIPPDAIHVGPDIDLTQMLQSAPKQSVWALEPGNYLINLVTHVVSLDAVIRITEKEITLIGADIENPPIIKGALSIQNGSIHLQNICMKPNEECPHGSLIRLNNSSGVFIGNHFASTHERERKNYWESWPTADDTITIQNCENQQFLWINNIIMGAMTYYPFDVSSLSIQDCTNINVQFSNNHPKGHPGTRYDTGGSSVTISNSSQVKIHLNPDTFTGGISEGIGLDVTNSTVSIYGGSLIGGDGFTAIQGTDGGVGVSAVESSIIHLYDLTVQGGKGGDGVIPGADGAPYYADETSQILFLSSANDWWLY